MDNLVGLPGCFFSVFIYPESISITGIAYISDMKVWNEIAFDFALTEPKVTASVRGAIIENVKKVILIGDTSVTVDTGRFYVTVKGRDFTICEIWEGRMEIEGIIEGIEFYQTLDKSQN